MIHQIETNLYARQVNAVKTDNFQQTLPSPQSDLVQQALKDPYVFQFLTLADNAKERELEQGLLTKIRDFMLELGSGFAFKCLHKIIYIPEGLRKHIQWGISRSYLYK